MTQEDSTVGPLQHNNDGEIAAHDGDLRYEQAQSAWVEPAYDSIDYAQETQTHRWAVILAVGTGLVWLTGLVWTISDGFANAPATREWPLMVAIASAPLALIAILYMVATRRSLRDISQRHSALHALETQADTTLSKIQAIGGFVDRARIELEAKANALASHGMDSAREMSRAAQMLSEVTDRVTLAQRSMATESDRANAQAHTLLEALPRIEDVAERTADRFRDAGLTAQKNGTALEVQIAALTSKADDAASTIAARISSLGEQSDAMGGHARAASETLVQLMEEHARALTETEKRAKATSEAVINHGVSCITQSAERLQSVRDSFGGENERWLRDTHDQLLQSREAAEALAAAIAANENRTSTAVIRIQELRDSDMATLQTLSSRYDEQLSLLTDRLAALRQMAQDCDAEISQRVAAADGMRQRAEDTLVAVEAALRELHESLPGALDRIGGQLDAHHRQLSDFSPQIERYETAAAATARSLEEGVTHSQTAAADMAARQQELQAALTNASDQANDMRRLISEVGEQLRAVSDGDAPRAAEAIESVRASAVQASERARASLETIVAPTASAFASELNSVLEAALSQHFDRRLEQLRSSTEQTVESATAVVADAAQRLAAIPAPQPMAETGAGPHGDMLARRVSVLTQSLQSAGVNVAELLGAEVSDATWDAYLKGDKSLFVRRANRLLDQEDSRAILARYAEDQSFRGHVNRYIADFEAMLRELLAAKDGHNLSVIVLSSDMGKLYVALATAIERLKP